jgi:hypothetical protein
MSLYANVLQVNRIIPLNASGCLLSRISQDRYIATYSKRCHQPRLTEEWIWLASDERVNTESAHRSSKRTARACSQPRFRS